MDPTVDFHMGPSTVWLPTKTIFFVFSRRKKIRQVWNNLRVSK